MGGVFTSIFNAVDEWSTADNREKNNNFPIWQTKFVLCRVGESHIGLGVVGLR